MRFLSVIGTRPQWSKVVPLPDHAVCNTGQHWDFDMDGSFGKAFNIRPKYTLNTRKLGAMIDHLMPILVKEKPSMVVVYGDTRSTLAGAMAAKFAGIAVAHVESGLRSGDMTQPEEIVRVAVDRIADMHFCPSMRAAVNLAREGITRSVHVVGDPMWDAMKVALPAKKIKGRFGLLTLHRAENANQQTVNTVFSALKEDGRDFVWPVHPNMRRFVKNAPKNVLVKPPQRYKAMVELEASSEVIITDSGGVQREGYWLAKPVIIVRPTTEWQEIVDDGWAVLATSKDAILTALRTHTPKPLLNPRHFMPEYGAKERIIKILA